MKIPYEVSEVLKCALDYLKKVTKSDPDEHTTLHKKGGSVSFVGPRRNKFFYVGVEETDRAIYATQFPNDTSTPLKGDGPDSQEAYDAQLHEYRWLQTGLRIAHDRGDTEMEEVLKTRIAGADVYRKVHARSSNRFVKFWARIGKGRKEKIREVAGYLGNKPLQITGLEAIPQAARLAAEASRLPRGAKDFMTVGLGAGGVAVKFLFPASYRATALAQEMNDRKIEAPIFKGLSNIGSWLADLSGNAISGLSLVGGPHISVGVKLAVNSVENVVFDIIEGVVRRQNNMESSLTSLTR